MPAPHGLSHINLLPKDSFEFSSLGKILKWSTTVGRVLVVMTEFVVLLAFASRFYFDKKLNDLSEELDSQIAIVEGYAEVETKMRDVLTRQSVVSDYLTNNIEIEKKMLELASDVPVGITLSDLSLSGKDATIKGVANSETSFARMLYKIKRREDVKRISMEETTFEQTSGAVKFGFRLTYK